jgi:predicted O-methyltransferase YrrM
MTREDRMMAIVEEADCGCAPYYEMLPSLIRERNYKIGIEIGVFVGGHAKAIIDNTDIWFLIGIDPYVMYEQSIKGIESQEDFEYIYNFILKRLDFRKYLHLRMTSDKAFEMLARHENKFDFVFIDGLHTYDQVKKELENYEKLIRKGGVIACHDYNHPTFPLLTVAIDEFAERHNAKINLAPFYAVYMDKTW